MERDQRGRVHVPLPDRAGDRRGETASGGPVHDDGGKSAIFHGIVTTARNRRSVTIITSEFHEYRANQTAKRLGITSYSTPSRTFFLYLPTFYVRELYGILYYKISK